MSKTLIRNAHIIDGSGAPGFKADVVLSGDKIASVGFFSPLSDSYEQIIEADGLTLTPGFIDMHSHSDLLCLAHPESDSRIGQGITTELLGQDGLGAAPVTNENVFDYSRHIAGLQGDFPLSFWHWRRFSDYLNTLENTSIAVNTAVLASHGPLRLAASGMENRSLTAKELALVSQELKEALEAGAFGLSTGLIYPPCVSADKVELTALTKITAYYGGLFVVHVRNERNRVKESILEIFDLAKKTGVLPHISHLKVIGRENWGSGAELLSLFDAANKSGLQAGFDQYPYPAGSTMLSILVPPHAHAGGAQALLSRLNDPSWRARLAKEMADGLPGWENIATAAGWDRILVTGIAQGKNKPLEGKTLTYIAALRHCTPQEAVFDLLLEEKLCVSMINFSISEEDVATIIRHPAGMLGTDGLLIGQPHPRAYGSTARIIEWAVKENSFLSLEEAINRMTGRPAARLGLNDRGLLRPGMAADLVLFDLERIHEASSFINPRRYPEGIEMVFVNGQTAMKNGRQTEALAGRLLRKSKSRTGNRR